MTTTGTYGFAPSGGEVLLNALSRIGKRGPDIKPEHLMTGAFEASLMQVEWNNRGPNLWTVDEQTIPTVVGTAVYAVPATTIMVLDVTIGFIQTDGSQTELRISPISRSEYMSYPNKTTPGRPTIYWYDRLAAPSITLWPVPDQVYNLNFFRYRQIQDFSLNGAPQPEWINRFLDAGCAGIAKRLARHYPPPPPATIGDLKADYEEAYKYAATQDVEDSQLYIMPSLSSYFRP